MSLNCIFVFPSSITPVLTNFHLAMKYGANISLAGPDIPYFLLHDYIFMERPDANPLEVKLAKLTPSYFMSLQSFQSFPLRKITALKLSLDELPDELQYI